MNNSLHGFVVSCFVLLVVKHCFELKCTFVPVTCNTPLISGIHKHALCLIDPVASVKTGKVAFLLSSMRCTVFTKCLSEFPTYNVQEVNLEK